MANDVGAVTTAIIVPGGELAAGADAVRIARIFQDVAPELETTGIAASRVLGIAGEDAVGVTGPKVAIKVAGRTRIPDILAERTLEEVKNVARQSFTSQLRDFYQYSQQNELDMILHTRSNTTFTKPLQQLINNGDIIHKVIPGL